MLFGYLLAIIAGIGWGFASLQQILCPVFAILPHFREIRDLTKMETSHLLYLILSAPVVWAFLLSCSCLAVLQFLPEFSGSFFFGLAVALAFILAEFGEEKRKLESRFMSALKRDLLAPLREPGARYHAYSPVQMRMACWRTPGLSVHEYGELLFECANCLRLRKLSQAEVCFRGTRRRFVVRCDLCREPSVIRIAGSFLSTYRAVTEGYVPMRKDPGPTPAEARPAAGPNNAAPRP